MATKSRQDMLNDLEAYERKLKSTDQLFDDLFRGIELQYPEFIVCRDLFTVEGYTFMVVRALNDSGDCVATYRFREDDLI